MIRNPAALTRGLFGSREADKRLPFHDKDGNTCSKEAIVATIESIATSLGEPLTDNHEIRRFGAHTIRVTAAQHLARIGISLPIIMLLARWESNIIMRYVSEAPLHTVTQEYRNLQAQSDIAKHVQDMKQEISRNIEFTANLDNDNFSKIAEQYKNLEERISCVEDSKGGYVINTDENSNKVHRVILDGDQHSRYEWRTYRGWKFAAPSCDLCKDPQASGPIPADLQYLSPERTCSHQRIPPELFLFRH